jgi:hypothetical protein
VQKSVKYLNQNITSTDEVVEDTKEETIDEPKLFKVTSKRNSSKPKGVCDKLDEKGSSKRPASDDDKGATNSDDDKNKSSFYDKEAVIEKLKMNLKSICDTKRGKQN